ncbi:hypothetical protein [Bdellovibrio sp. HCB2-146]|uniref:hypothetical protein n=1 Tax=Bdellovibrio sp. HCB2-146 TaxID=3394362 RepID=UPI0039BD8A8C
MKLVTQMSIVMLSLCFYSTAYAGKTEADKVAKEALECRRIQPFYWEVGDANSVLASSSVGSEYDRESEIRMASASKFIFAAYVFEKLRGDLNPHQKNLLLMLGGYEDFTPAPCELRLKVSGCFDARQNSRVSKESLGKFYYSGGDAQALAVELGLGNLNREALAREVSRHLGQKFKIQYPNLALAGGAKMTPGDYAEFLKSILRGDYLIKNFLGKEAICTSAATCKTAVFSPAKEPWLYSFHHWVELNQQKQVEAFSSPGAFGFYPWISADKKIYGVLARENKSRDAYWESVECGRLIRRAYLQK